MKRTLPYLVLLALSGFSIAGDRVVTSRQTYEVEESEPRRGRMKSAGTPGAFYHSNFQGNAVVLLNTTPEFVTFFVYFADISGPNDVNEMIRIGAPVYPTVMQPYQKGVKDKRGAHYWVTSKPGKWRIDPAAHRLVPY